MRIKYSENELWLRFIIMRLSFKRAILFQPLAEIKSHYLAVLKSIPMMSKSATYALVSGALQHLNCCEIVSIVPDFTATIFVPQIPSVTNDTKINAHYRLHNSTEKIRLMG